MQHSESDFLTVCLLQPANHTVHEKIVPLCVSSCNDFHAKLEHPEINTNTSPCFHRRKMKKLFFRSEKQQQFCYVVIQSTAKPCQS